MSGHCLPDVTQSGWGLHWLPDIIQSSQFIPYIRLFDQSLKGLWYQILLTLVTVYQISLIRDKAFTDYRISHSVVTVYQIPLSLAKIFTDYQISLNLPIVFQE